MELYLPLFILIAGLFGIIVGSFCNVLIMRHGTGIGIGGRSRCLSCKETLRARELIPLVSFILQRGRCTHCGSRFSWQYPAIELLSGLFAASIVFASKSAVEGVLLALAGIPLMVIVGYDSKHYIIPTMYARMLWVVSLFSAVLFFDQYTIMASLGLILFFYSIWLFSDGKAMGFGDVGLVGALALLFGYPVSVLGALFAFWLGAVVGIALLFQSHSGLTLKSEVPFGPFLIIGYMLAFVVARIFSDSFPLLL
ncbi:MAG: prepilin peptidase [bacterium]|nr:prepilin peptidase [bacterium]